MKQGRRLDIVFFDAASGHRSAASALLRAFTQRLPYWRVRSVNLIDVLAPHALFRMTTRLGIRYFNDMVRGDRVRDLERLIKFSLFCCDRVGSRGCARIASFWQGNAPDLLLSVTPMNNEVLQRSFRLANPAGRYITLPVDLEEVLPRYWFTPGIEAHYLLPCERLLDQARQAGLGNGSLQRISGMPVDPAFYDEQPIERETALTELGLDPRLPVCVVSFGGQGSRILPRLAAALDRAKRRFNVVFLCGSSRRAADRLRQQRFGRPTLVLDYLQDTPVRYFRLADVVVGKPGSMTIFESLVCGVPLLALKSGGMAPVQRGNERWLEVSGAGLVVDGPQSLPDAVDRVLEGAAEFRAAARKHGGRGVFDAVNRIAELA